MDYTVHGILQARKLEWVAFPFLGDLPNKALNPGLPHCRRILYPEPSGKPRKAIVSTFDHTRITKIYFLYMHLEETVKKETSVAHKLNRDTVMEGEK